MEDLSGLAAAGVLVWMHFRFEYVTEPGGFGGDDGPDGKGNIGASHVVSQIVELCDLLGGNRLRRASPRAMPTIGP